MNLCRVFVVGLFAIGLAACTSAEAPTLDSNPGPVQPTPFFGTVEVIGGDEEALRSFIEQYANRTEDTTITIGELSDDLPIDLPLPDSTTVTGSIASHYADDTQSWEILFETDLSLEDLRDYYRESLPTRRWETLPDIQTGGFENYDGFNLIVCHRRQPLFMSIFVNRFNQSQTRGTIMLHGSGGRSACPGPGGADETPGADEVAYVIPPIFPPPGMQVRSGGSGGTSRTGELSAYQTTVIGGRGTSDEIAEHYAALVEDAGWTRIGEGQMDDAAWRTWTFSDENGATWTGQLLVVGTGASNEWMVWIRVSLVPEEN